MIKITFQPPLVIANSPVQITDLEYDELNNQLYITFPMIDDDPSIKRKKATLIQKLIEQLNSKSIANNWKVCLRCQIPETNLTFIQNWLYKNTDANHHECITTAFTQSSEKKHDKEEIVVSAKIPPKGKSITLFEIGPFQDLGSKHDIATAIKIGNHSEYFFKREIMAEIEAFHAALSQLFLTPACAPKVRSVHTETDAKPVGIVSKKVPHFISLFDLLVKHNKILDKNELLKIGIVPLLVLAYATEESDLNAKNYGINRELTPDKKIADGTNIIRLDPGFSGYTLVNCAAKLYGVQGCDDARQSNAFPRKVKPEDAFPIHADDIRSLLNLLYATPTNWPFHANRKLRHNLFSDDDKEEAATRHIDDLVDDEEFNREQYLYFLKIILINSKMLESLGNTFISDSDILCKVHGNDIYQKINPAFLETTEFRLNSIKYGDEYQKAVAKTLYVNHYTNRFAQIRNTLLQMPEFREYFLKNDEDYIDTILREFQDYNNQFAPTSKTPESDISIVERMEGINIKTPYKKKYLDRLVNIEQANQDFIDIRNEANRLHDIYHAEFLVSLEKYLKSHVWNVGYQLSKKVIIDENHVEKPVPTCVYNQMNEILNYQKHNQSLKTTIQHIMQIGNEAYNNRNSSNSSADSMLYYNLFKDKHVEKVYQGIKPAPLDECFITISP